MPSTSILITDDYQTPSTPIELTYDASVTYKLITDADGISKIDGKCTVNVADGVSLAAETSQQNFEDNEGVPQTI
jgi:hypothetical protein